MALNGIVVGGGTPLVLHGHTQSAQTCRSGNITMDRDSKEAKEASSAKKPELEERRLMSAHRGRAGSGRHPATSEMRDLMGAQLGFCAGSTLDPAT